MLESGMNKIEELFSGYVDVKYHEISDEEAWRVDMIKEIVDMKNGDLEIAGISQEDLDQIQEYLCTQ